MKAEMIFRGLFNKDKSRGLELGLEQLKIDEDTFINSIFVSQVNTKVEEKGRNYIIQKLTNMIQSGDESISYDKIMQKLQKKLLDEVGTERTQNKPLNTIIREVGLLEEKRETLINNREKQSNISDLNKSLDDKLISCEKDIEKVSKVLEIKNRYDTLLKERENDYEIALKIAEKERDKAIEKNKKTKNISIILITTISAILVGIGIYFKWYILAIIATIIGISSAIIVYKLLSKDVLLQDVPNIDVTREDFKKKEDKELYFLKKDGIGDSLISRKTNDLKQLLDGYKKKKDDLILEKHKLKIESDSLKENIDRLNEIEERLEDLYEKEEDIRRLEYSLKLSMEKLTEAYSDLKKEVVPKLENKIKDSIVSTTNNNYTKVFYNDSDGILVENFLGDIVNLDKLSVGTIDQAYLGFRFAVSEEMSNLPIILDESFAFCDDERLSNILNLISTKYKDKQVILLSCSSREKNLLSKMNVKFNMVEL